MQESSQAPPSCENITTKVILQDAGQINEFAHRSAERQQKFKIANLTKQ